MTRVLNPLPTSIIPAQWQSLIEENCELKAEVKRLRKRNSEIAEDLVRLHAEVYYRVSRGR